MDIISYLQNRKIGISSKNPPIGFFNSSGHLNGKLRFIFKECNKRHLWDTLREKNAREFFKTEEFKEIKKELKNNIDIEHNYLIPLLFLHIFFIAKFGWDTYLKIYI